MKVLFKLRLFQWSFTCSKPQRRLGYNAAAVHTADATTAHFFLAIVGDTALVTAPQHGGDGQQL